MTIAYTASDLADRSISSGSPFRHGAFLEQNTQSGISCSRRQGIKLCQQTNKQTQPPQKQAKKQNRGCETLQRTCRRVGLLRRFCIYTLSPCGPVPAGSPSRGGDVAVHGFFFFYINQPSLPTPFHSVLVSISVFTVLSTAFHSTNSPDNSLLSRSVLPVLLLPYWSFQLYVSLCESLIQP